MKNKSVIVNVIFSLIFTMIITKGELTMIKFKETEYDKICDELLLKLIPKDVLDGYYAFGYAHALVNMRDIIQYCVIDEYADKLLNFIDEITKQEPVIQPYYERLKKDRGI
jgi:hypothetical protein